MFSPTGGSWGYLDEARTHWVVLKSNMIPDGTTAPWSKRVMLIIYHHLTIIRNPCIGRDWWMYYRVYADYDHGLIYGAQTNHKSVSWSLKQLSFLGKVGNSDLDGVCPFKMHQDTQQFIIAIFESRTPLEIIWAVFKTPLSFHLILVVFSKRAHEKDHLNDYHWFIDICKTF